MGWGQLPLAKKHLQVVLAGKNSSNCRSKKLAVSAAQVVAM
jgi:hypothetical protein